MTTGTIRLQEGKIQTAVAELENLRDTLEEIDIMKGKEDGGSGYTCDSMQVIEEAVGNVKASMQTLIETTVIFLNGTQGVLQSADEASGKRIGGEL